jgi:putative transposase
MKKAYKFRLYPTSKQEKVLFWTLSRCRELYNAALAERKEAYCMAGKSIGYYEQKRDLPEIKAEIRQEYQDIYSQVLQDVLLRVKRAFDAFFRRVNTGEEPGYPRFQGRNRYTSLTYPQSGYTIDVHEKRATVTLSKIGTIKVKLHRKIEGPIKTCTIKYEAGQWYAVFACEIQQPEPLPQVTSEVGIDLGVTHFAALSDGTFIESPRYYRKAQKKLEKLQQALSRKKRGSHRRDRARKAVAKVHRKIANQRRDFHHKQAKRLVSEQQTIEFEKLAITTISKRSKPKQDETTGQYLPNGAAAKSGLNKSILDAGWGHFQQIVSHKAACAGRTVLFVNPRYTSQVCSQCGAVRKKSLEERWHSCECGCELDRDTNAAMNILRLGRSQRGATCVEAPCL